MIHNKLLFQAGTSRRNFLKGAGAALLLPQFDSLAKSKKISKEPVRLVFLQVPNGIIMNKWTPEKFGKYDKTPQTLKPLEELKKHFQILSGLKHQNAKANGDGGGDHARAQGTFLTGVQVLKHPETARNGISVDQVAAKYMTKTYLPSIELASERGRLSGSCDSGYNCSYQYNLSWKNESLPMVPESSPERAFNRLFVIKNKNNKNGISLKDQSILDLLKESSKDLKRHLGKEDTEKLNQYYASLRETEKKMQKLKIGVEPRMFKRDFTKKPQSFQETIEALMDVMVLAFEVDATRVATMILGSEGTNRQFAELGIKGGHHAISHHGGKENLIKDLEKIDLFYVQRLAYFLNALQQKKINGKSLLEQSMIVYGSGISDGNKHKHDNLPILLAGHGGGLLSPGVHRDFPDTPLCNLYNTILQKINCPVNSFGDSTGVISGI